MSKLDELIAELCPDGVEFHKLIEVCTDIIVPMRDRPKDLNGPIPWCRIEDKEGQFFNGSKSGLGVTEETVKKMNLKVFPTGTVICSCSASIGAYAINTQPLITNQTFIGLVCGEWIYNKYLLYYMETQTAYLLSQASTGTIPYISRKKFEGMSIPVPPLDVQREIVRVLDKYTLLSKELYERLSSELSARRKQYEYCRNKLLSFNPQVTWKTLGDIGKVSMCKRIMKNETSSEGDVPFYKIGTFGKQADAYISWETFERYKAQYSYPKRGDILISAAGTIGRTVVFDGEPAYFQDSNIVWVANDESQVLNEFLYYWYQTNPWKVATGGTIARLYNDNIAGAKVPVLPLDTQKRLVGTLSNFDAVCNDLNIGLPAEIEARQKQYEYFRDKLLCFKEKQ